MGPNISISCDCIPNSLSKPINASILDPRHKKEKALSVSRPDSFTSTAQSDNCPNHSMVECGCSSPKKLSVHDFVVQKVLGRGASGKVLLVTKKRGPRKFYAMKIIQKSLMYSANLSTHVQFEKETLKNSNSPFIVKLTHSFQTPTKIYLVMEYMPGGDLFHLLRNKKRFSVQTARLYCAEVILALQYLHDELKLIYRDLKPENILISEAGHLKITDFGLAKSFEENCVSFVGTPEYVSPEIILNREQSSAVDVWSLGILLFEMIAGYSPFSLKSKSLDEIQRRIVKEEVDFPAVLTAEARDLVSRMLRKDPKERITLSEAKKHGFFEGLDWRKVEKLEYPATFRGKEERFNPKEQKDLKESYDLNSMPDLEGLTFTADDTGLMMRND